MEKMMMVLLLKSRGGEGGTGARLFAFCDGSWNYIN